MHARKCRAESETDMWRGPSSSMSDYSAADNYPTNDAASDEPSTLNM
jgi:hypothetical protein